MKNIIHVLLLLCATFSLHAQTVYVKAGATGDGSSWANATGDLQMALSNASEGTSIWIAKGSYYPITCSPCDFAAQSTYFEIPDGVKLFGGFSGSETSIDQRDISNNETILSGDINQDGTLSGNAFTVLYTRNVGDATEVDGVTITMASATTTGGSTESHFQSGAWFNDGSLEGFKATPKVRNCKFINNEAIAHGAAMFNYGNNYAINSGGAIYSNAIFEGVASAKFINSEFSNNTTDHSGGAVFNNAQEKGVANATFTDCSFSNNKATKVDGGAVYNFGKNGTANAEFTNCDFSKNEAHLFGGAVENDGSFGGESNARFSSCTFTENLAKSDGGAVFNYGFENGTSNAYFEDCVFDRNHSDFAGGAIFNNGILGESSPTIINCQFMQNETDTYGGAIYNQGKSGKCNPMIVNCVFYKNMASSAGAIYNLGADNGQCNPTITNCTFYGNEAMVGGAIYSNATDLTGECSPVVTNCIIWGNNADFGPVFRIVFGTPNISYSLVGAEDCDGMYSGLEGNITCGNGILFDEDPMFEDAENGNLHLRSDSPAIDKGDDNAISSTGVTTDLDQHVRSQNGKVDMGAYEFGNAGYTPPTIASQPQGQEVCESENLSFEVGVNGTGPFLYQWKKDGANINGATNKILQLNNLLTSDAGDYTCQVTGPQSEELTSTLATLVVNPKLTPTIELAASTTSICTNDKVDFTVTETNAGISPTYQWSVNGMATGGNSASISLASLENGDVVKVVLTSSETCTTVNPVESESITIQVDVDEACMTSTLEMIDKSLVQLFPNPTSGKLTLQIKELSEDFDLLVFNVHGQLLQSQSLQLDGAAFSQELNFSAFANGVYFIRLVNEEKALVRKIVVE